MIEFINTHADSIAVIFFYSMLGLGVASIAMVIEWIIEWHAKVKRHRTMATRKHNRR